MRTLIWLVGGLIIGIIVHLSIILIIPSFATQNTWARVRALGAEQQVIVLEPVAAGAPNPFGLDPKLAYAVCRLDLTKGPGIMVGTLPQAFWSVSVFDENGVSLYSTTNRSGIGQKLDVGIFNPPQTRLLAQQKISIENGLLVVESSGNNIFVAVRLTPEHAAMLPRYRQALAGLTCKNLNIE